MGRVYEAMNRAMIRNARAEAVRVMREVGPEPEKHSMFAWWRRKSAEAHAIKHSRLLKQIGRPEAEWAWQEVDGRLVHFSLEGEGRVVEVGEGGEDVPADAPEVRQLGAQD